MHRDPATDHPHLQAEVTELHQDQAIEVQVRHQAAGRQATVPEVQVEAATAAAVRQAAGAAIAAEADTAEAEEDRTT